MRVDQWHFAALRWYFTEYEAEIGIKAMDPLSLGIGQPDPDRVGRAVRRARKIERVLEAMPSRHRKVLVYVHMPRVWPVSDVGGLADHLKGIVCMLKKPESENRRAWAESRFEEAHNAFTKTANELGVKGIA